uniref:FZ domain-containing protein n=1 Tax=Gopherus evgoodei TaxID=1825980 RepID=A0A8C4VUX1_9SAUR
MPGGTVLLALAALLAVGQDYDSPSWRPEQPPSGRGYGKQPQCVDIPPDLPLCHDVGYKRIWLPKLLEHDSLAQVKQQAGAWVPLLAKRCHGDTQLLLCSLFAPSAWTSLSTPAARSATPPPGNGGDKPPRCQVTGGARPPCPR